MSEQENVPLPEHQPDVVEEDTGWNFTQIWNESIEKDDNREYEPRNYLWASEVGKLYSDTFLKMKGTKQTNPPNARSYRKFEAGNIWESIVMIILMRAGVLIEEQRRIKVGYEGLLEVSGKLDFYVGGKVNIEKAREEVDNLYYLPEKTRNAVGYIAEYLHEKYPEGLEKRALELKSCSSFMMNAMEITKKPLDIHALQAYHYTKDEEINRADVVYVCRDDCRIMSFPIFADSEPWETKYYNWVKQMTEYYNSDKMPPKETPVTFNESSGKFELDRMIGWSAYLTLTWGYKDQMEFDEKWGKLPTSWNGVLKRIAMEKNMTKLNLEKIEEMKVAGFDAHECAKSYVIPVVEDESEEVS